MPYAIGIIRYRRPLQEVLQQVEAHRAYLHSLSEAGLVLASGPFQPRSGGAVLIRVPEGDSGALDRIRDNDPFVKTGVAQYEMLEWDPSMGRDGLDQL